MYYIWLFDYIHAMFFRVSTWKLFFQALAIKFFRGSAARIDGAPCSPAFANVSLQGVRNLIPDVRKRLPGVRKRRLVVRIIANRSIHKYIKGMHTWMNKQI